MIFLLDDFWLIIGVEGNHRYIHRLTLSDIMAIILFNQLDLNKTYTYADYLTWKFKDRVELILGKVFRMSPAPSTHHQHCVSALNAIFYNHLINKPCRVFPAPFDVIFPLSAEPDTVVQPDVTVVCDQSKITERGCIGVPDLVVEVVSRSSVKRDLHEKYNLYESAGVKEYWLVNPMDRSVVIFVLQATGQYQPAKPLTYGDKATSQVLAGLVIEVDDLFITLAEEEAVNYS